MDSKLIKEILLNKNLNKKDNNKRKSFTRENQENDKEFLKIWDLNPSFHDINHSRTSFQILFMVFSSFFYFITSFLLIGSVMFSVILSSLELLLFFVLFRDYFLLANKKENLFSKSLHKDFIYWAINSENRMFFITNKIGGRTTGIKGFRIDLLPENVEGNMKGFINALYSNNIPFTLQIVQNPLLTDNNKNSKAFRLSIYLFVFHSFIKKPSVKCLKEASSILEFYSIGIQNSFISNFHHSRLAILELNELLCAIRTLFLKTSLPQNDNFEVDGVEIINLKKFLKRLFFIITYLALMSLILSLLKYSPIFILMSIIIGSSLFLILIKGELIILLSKDNILKSSLIKFLNPFKGIRLFKLRNISDVIFFTQDDSILGGIKLFQLNQILHPPYCLVNKFYQPLIKFKLSYSTSFTSIPIDFLTFYKRGRKFLKDDLKMRYLNDFNDKIKINNWLMMRLGAWKNFFLISISRALYINDNIGIAIEKVASLLQKDEMIIESAFNQAYKNFSLKKLNDGSLFPGFQLCSFKNNNYRENGTHLTYNILQGAELAEMIKFPNEFIKGIESKIASEFNSPTYLENYITIGNVINTEYLEEECPAGLTLEQTRSLILLNGTQKARTFALMKIAKELIDKGHSLIIFDFTGDWTKFLNHFVKKRKKLEIIHFKYGKNYLIEIFNSQIKNEDENTEYLNMVYDALSLCFKMNKREISTLRTLVKKDLIPLMQISEISKDLKDNNSLDIDPATIDSVVSTLNEFNLSDSMFFFKKDKGNILPLKPHEFIKIDKSIIIDLSNLYSMDKKSLVSLLIISKIIQYLNKGLPYRKKSIILPEIENIFHAQFLDKYNEPKFSSISNFLDPLLNSEIGMIFSAARVNHLHPTIFNYVENIITFKTTNIKDWQVLKNLMGLEEIHGTGYYSKNRNEAYQMRYIAMMRQNEAVMHRSDIFSPFPININYDEFEQASKMNMNEIISYMKNLGYDLRDSEREILKLIKPTLIEKDLEEYHIYAETIIKFLKMIKKLEKIGVWNDIRLKEELGKFLYPELSRSMKKKRNIREVRDKIFNKLIYHEYLIGSSQTQASGMETPMISYKVNEKKFNKILDEYDKMRSKNIPQDFSIEIIQDETENLQEDIDNLIFKNINNDELKDLLLNSLISELHGFFQWNLYKIYLEIEKKNYETAINLGKKLTREFLEGVFEQFMNASGQRIKINFSSFLEILSSMESFPFSIKTILNFINENGINNDEIKDSLEPICLELYHKLVEFYDKMNIFIKLNG